MQEIEAEIPYGMLRFVVRSTSEDVLRRKSFRDRIAEKLAPVTPRGSERSP